MNVYVGHSGRLSDGALTVVVSASTFVRNPQGLNHATAIPVFPLMLTQGAKKLTSAAQEARIADIRKVALKPSM
jgi:hypothetical protein